MPYFLSKYDPDPLRYYLTATAPETRDTEFFWEDFVDRNNNELVATWGNLGNRMLSFAYKRFDGRVPEPGELDDEDRALLAKVEAAFETIGKLYNAVHLRAALAEVLALAREANGYLDRKAPWFQIKTDRQAAATTVYVILRAIDSLKTLVAPVLPHSAQKIHEFLGYEGQLFGTQQVVTYEEETRSHDALTYDHSGAVGTWAASALPVGQALREPAPLFRKLDEGVVETAYAGSSFENALVCLTELATCAKILMVSGVIVDAGLSKKGVCRKAIEMEWDGEKQARLDALRAVELGGTLDEAGEAELKALLELVEAEEQERLGPALARIREEQTALRLKVQESEAANEQLVDLIAQQERWLADARHLLHDLQRRHRAMQKTYQLITGEPLTVS